MGKNVIFSDWHVNIRGDALAVNIDAVGREVPGNGNIHARPVGEGVDFLNQPFAKGLGTDQHSTVVVFHGSCHNFARAGAPSGPADA